jgi:type II secretion system protein L
VHNIAIIRLIDGELAWYPPGSSDGPRWLRQDAEQDALRAAIADRRLTPVFAVPGEDARLLTVSIAPEEKRHFARSLPYMLEEQLAGDVADLHFAHCPLDKLEYAVAVCSVAAMETYSERLHGFPGITQWLPEPLLLPWSPREWTLVLEERGAIVRTGRCAGFGVEPGLLPALLEAALREGEPDSIVVYGRDQAEELALIPESLRQRVQWRTGDLYAALLVAEQPEPMLNLRQGAFAQRLPLRRWWSQWRVAAALFGVALALHLVSTWSDYRQLRKENIALRTAVETSYRKAYPRGAIADVEKQLRRQLDALSGSAEASSFVALMERVGGVIADSEGTSIVSINYNDKAGEMRLNIVAQDYGAVEQVRSGINKAGLEAAMENSSAQGEQVRARLRVGERS